MADVSRLAEVRARLELPLVRRAAGLLEGHHKSRLKGQGLDFDDLSLYSPGDDIGDIDWKSSARAGIPVIRRFIKESNTNCVIAADIGRAMGALAPSGETKGEVAVTAAATVAYLARDRGDPVALVAADAQRRIHRPPRTGAPDIEITLSALLDAYDPHGPEQDLDVLADQVAVLFPRRALVVLITDEAHPNADQLHTLRKLRLRHDVLVIRVADADPVTAIPGGDRHDPTDVPVADVVGTLRLPPYFRGRADLAEAAGQAMANRRRAVTQMLTRERISTMVTYSSADVMPAFIAMLGRRRLTNA